MKQAPASSTGGASASSTTAATINSTAPISHKKQESILDDKLFFTTSDVIKRINSTIHDNEDNNDGGTGSGSGGTDEGRSGGFELQRKFEGGYTCKANDSDVALVDFQSKVKQAAQMVSTLSPEKKIEWAMIHRQRGNALFQKCDYKEAMDVYLTCLVAIEHGSGGSSDANTNETAVPNNSVTMKDEATRCTTSSTATATIREDNGSNTVNGNDRKTTAEEEDQRDRWNKRTDEEIKLPILLNLSACALKLGMYQKTEKFCNFAITEMPCGRTSTKAHFRRGRARMLMGSYRGAKDDFDTALELLLSSKTEGGSKDREAEIKAVKNEMIKLGRLTEAGQKNRVKCKRAMKKVLGGGGGENDENLTEGEKCAISSSIVVAAAGESVITQNKFNATGAVRMPSLEGNPAEVSEQHSTGLYDDVTNRRAYSTLREKFKGKEQKRHQTTVPEEERSYMLWYITMMDRSLRKILYWLGDKDAMTRTFEELEDEFSAPTKEKRL